MHKDDRDFLLPNGYRPDEQKLRRWGFTRSEGIVFEVYMGINNIERINRVSPLHTDSKLMEKRFNLFIGEKSLSDVEYYDDDRNLLIDRDLVEQQVALANDYLLSFKRFVPVPIEQYEKAAILDYNTEEYDPEIVQSYFQTQGKRLDEGSLRDDERHWLREVRDKRRDAIRDLREPLQIREFVNHQTVTTHRPEVSMKDRNMTITLFR